MRNKKGFTLVELVIVIAVIAILAGVMIGTFASVVKKANESRKAQEMAAAKTEQTANDVIEKLNNSNWLGWEDFEEKLAERLTKAYQDAKSDVPVDAIQDAVKGAVAKYFAEHANENTGLTEEQVKYIVETAVAKNAYVGVTEAQVKAIINAAVSGTSTLTKSQVQAIVDAAQARNLTLAQVSKAIADATPKDYATLKDVEKINEANAKIVAAVNAVSSKALTEKQVEDIINAAVWNAGGVTKTWFDSTNYEATKQYTVSNAQEVAGLATLVNGGYDFEGKTITLNTTDKETTIKLDASNWTPIGNTRGNEFKGTISGGEKGVVIEGLTLDEQFNAVKNGYLINCSSTGYMDKVGVGFVAYLGEGATLENITFTNVKVDIRDPEMDGISVGVAVGYLDGGTVKNVKVTDGYVRSVYRVAGLIGA
ncbi:MAG: type II secretion system protein, partial [Eubacteriales bacterium]|nr:type II secretion system protein [Eubacterium sp.]MDY5493049.1 type II secretion system protein [Eubacteriales bacterium]